MLHRTRLFVSCAIILFLVRVATAAPEFRVSATGGNSCGFWGSSCGACCNGSAGFAACGTAPVTDQQSLTTDQATYRYAASAGCGELSLHTEIDWFCHCGSLCGQNGGLATFTLDDVVFTGPAGPTSVNFRFSLDFAVSDGNWQLRGSFFPGAYIDTGEQSGFLPPTRFVSSMGSAELNFPRTFIVTVTTGIVAFDSSPQPRSDAIVQFPCGQPVFTFYDANGDPLSGYAAHSAVCELTPSCPGHSAEMNADGVTDGRDIRRFVDAVIAGSTAPSDTCPGDFSDNCIMDLPDVPGFTAALLGF
jgi:hypothetical protein